MRREIGFCPTLACADYLRVADEITILDRFGARSYHIDIMDGNFVPNYCLNFDYLKAIKGFTSTPCDVHLMTTEVERDIKESVKCGADAIAFHVCRIDLEIPYLLALIKENGRKAGLVLNPEEPVDVLSPFLPFLDYVIIMAVKPGFSGQKFLIDTYDKISELNILRDTSGLDFKIMVDGGINFDNASKCISCGADVLVAGALCIFSHIEGLEKDTARFMRCLE